MSSGKANAWILSILKVKANHHDFFPFDLGTPCPRSRESVFFSVLTEFEFLAIESVIKMDTMFSYFDHAFNNHYTLSLIALKIQRNILFSIGRLQV